MLHVHRSDRADGLIEALRGLFAEPPPDPFAREVIAVPTRGMERWLTQRLSNALGICANVDFPFPRTVVGDAVAAASGIDPATDPWLPERMVWPLLEVVDAGARRAVDAAARRRTCSRAARAGSPRCATSPTCSTATRCSARSSSRPGRPARASTGSRELWRRLNARSGRARPGLPRGGRVRAAARRAGPRGPARSASRCSASRGSRPASCASWSARARTATCSSSSCTRRPRCGRRLEGTPRVTRRAEDPTVETPENRLLGSWGHDARELQLVLGPDVELHRASGRAPDRLAAGAPAGRRARGHRPAGAPHPGHADARPPLDPTTAASRSTPATAARARSRSCATRSCTRWRRTRRWSRAT